MAPKKQRQAADPAQTAQTAEKMDIEMRELEEVELEFSQATIPQLLKTLILEVRQIRKDAAAARKDIDQAQKDIVDNKSQMKVMGEEMGEMREGSAAFKNEMELFVSKADFERMSFFLRFQNVPENADEILRDVMGEALAGFLNRSKQAMIDDIDMIYRINSAYARINNVPREIHIKFTRRFIRDEILKAQRDAPLVIQQKEITILKQIPKKIREIRRKYSSLSKKLFKKGVWFRWLIPEGMLIFWEGGRVKISTVQQAEDFIQKHRSVLEEDEGGGEASGPSEVAQATGKTPRKQRSKK